MIERKEAKGVCSLCHAFCLEVEVGELHSTANYYTQTKAQQQTC